MLLYRGIITLDYDPSTDVLTTSMPNIKQFALPEVSFCLDLMVESMRNYDIKNLLLDSSKSVIEVDEEAYKTISRKFTIDLMSTRLKKIARVEISDQKWEDKYKKLSSKLRQKEDLALESRNFICHAEARNWLVFKKPIRYKCVLTPASKCCCTWYIKRARSIYSYYLVINNIQQV